MNKHKYLRKLYSWQIKKISQVKKIYIPNNIYLKQKC